jgi:hypothetical protein
MGRPARYVADYSGTALLSAGYFIRHFPDTEVAAREADLLPVGYFHVVFTLPAEISPIAYQNKAVLAGAGSLLLLTRLLNERLQARGLALGKPLHPRLECGFVLIAA